MKKIILLSLANVLMLAFAFAQTPMSKTTLSTSQKMKLALENKGNSQANILPNADFNAWVQDSIETMDMTVLHFDRPDNWAPVAGIFYAYFMNLPIPLTQIIESSTGNSAAKIWINELGMGTDMATVLSTDKKVKQLQGLYKFSGNGDYPASISVYATKYDATGDSSALIGVGTYTMEHFTGDIPTSFVVDVNYVAEGLIPDTMIVFVNYLEGEIGTHLIVDDMKIITEEATGINKSRSSELSIYPNPANDEIKIKWNKTLESDNAEVSIMSIDGKLVKHYSDYSFNSSLNISDIDNGIYLIKVMDEKGTMITKIVIN